MTKQWKINENTMIYSLQISQLASINVFARARLYHTLVGNTDDFSILDYKIFIWQTYY